MKRDRLAWVVMALLAMAAGWWLSLNTEWVEDSQPRGAQGEALTNPVYAFEQMLRRLGMQVEHRESLDPMPPRQARLLLLSSDWAVIPGRAEQLHQWVLQGGHLVLTHSAGWAEEGLTGWVPVDVAEAGNKDKRKALPPSSKPSPSAAAPSPNTRTELISSPPLWEGVERIVTCDFNHQFQRLRTRPGRMASWTLARGDDAHALRLPLGQGSVTVLNTAAYLFHNTPALRCDTPLMLAAALQAEPGATAWIYLDEKREPLLPWLWQQGWIAIVAGLLALAAALWRGAVRFGPRQAPAPRLRRSISEQVRGLGAYLQRGGTEALLAAQQRALDETAARALPNYRRLPRAERVQAISARTGLPADALAVAMTARHATRAELPPRLQLLETARRRLL